ncbi:MAG: hypothetical protein ACM3S5_07485 [Rhodospirillales bacterium]
MAFAGPATLKLRQEIDPRSPVSATVKHGDRLGIIRRRRVFVLVRTADGRQGWTDMRQLMPPAQMEELDRLAERARRLPSHGAATVYEPLNVHTEPHRSAPSIHQITAGELVDVVDSALAPRVPYNPPDLIPKPPPPQPKPRKPAAEPRVPPPSMPPAPKPPLNWLELSKTTLEPAPPPPPPEPAKPVPVDDWSLVRLSNGRAGWVLTGALRMHIPDEVAQYSEGHRITSYFAMADVPDGEQIRHHWLWTTLSKTRQPYQFDSFRYFIWNPRRRRYETAYIARNLKGYFPVEVQPGKVTPSGKEESFPKFSLILEDEAGIRWRKTYALQTYRVVLVDTQKYEPAASAPLPQQPSEAKPQQTGPGFFQRIAQALAGWKRRVFGS